jgi:hypothetical protein
MPAGKKAGQSSKRGGGKSGGETTSVRVAVAAGKELANDVLAFVQGKVANGKGAVV